MFVNLPTGYSESLVYQALPLACVRQLISLRHVVVVSLLVNKLEYDEGSMLEETGFIFANCPLIENIKLIQMSRTEIFK